MSTTIESIKEVVTSSVTEVLRNNNVQTTSIKQDMDISCSKPYYDLVVNLCNEKKKEYTDNNISFNEDLIPACVACSFTDVTQKATLSINVSDVVNNTIANNIKTSIVNKLDTDIKYSADDNDIIENKTIIRNRVETNFNTQIVNDTINMFIFEQKIKATNMKLKSVNQSLVVTAIVDNIVNNFINNDVEFKSAVESIDRIYDQKALKEKEKAEAAAREVENKKQRDQLFNWGIIFMVFLLVLFIAHKIRSRRQMIIQSQYPPGYR